MNICPDRKLTLLVQGQFWTKLVGYWSTRKESTLLQGDIHFKCIMKPVEVEPGASEGASAKCSITYKYVTLTALASGCQLNIFLDD